MNVDNTIESPAVLSVCTGIRGLERGVERAIGPLRTIAYVEIEAFIIENLLAGMEAGVLAPAPIWSNLKTFPWRFFRGKVGLLLGGYPCQPFSVAGKQRGTTDPRHLWPFIKSGIRTVRPLACFFENVAAHLNLGYEEVKRDLEEMGYVVKEGIYAAEEVGAPHQRERLFILAILANAESYVRGLYKRSRRPFERTPFPFWSGEELGNAAGPPEREQTEQTVAFANDGDTREKSGFSGELANADGDGPGTESGDPRRQGGEDEGKAQWQERNNIQRERSWSDIGNSGEAMADPGSEGLEGQWPRGGCSRPELSLSSGGSGDRWPSRPGEPQQAWESPRVISRAAESSMGLSAHGYNFREDILRALGNGVVEQQAEYAFRDLIGKHIEAITY